jgi:hypothetical protein
MTIPKIGHNGGPPLEAEHQTADNVVRLPRRKGRPPRPSLPEKVESDDRHFQAVAQAISGLALKRALWNPARQRVRSQADRDRRLRPATAKILGFYLDSVNRQRGYDWHAPPSSPPICVSTDGLWKRQTASSSAAATSRGDPEG